MAKHSRKEEKPEATISDILRDFKEHKSQCEATFGTTLDFNEFLKFCIDKYKILPE